MTTEHQPQEQRATLSPDVRAFCALLAEESRRQAAVAAERREAKRERLVLVK